MKNTIKKLLVKLNITNIPSIFFYVFRIFPIKKNKIVFVNFSGKGYGDNPKYIAEEILKDKKEYQLVWLTKNFSDASFPKEIKRIKMFSIKSFYELATAKIWINNSRFDQFVVKRKKQFYIQTWHGGLALKRIEYDAEDKLSEYYRKVMKKDNRNINLMLSNSDFCTNMYKKGFKYHGRILEVGSPRNDILVNKQEELKSKIIDFYNIKEEKILLYAPTFRKSYDKNPYDIDFIKLKQKLEENTNKTWRIMIRLHPRIADATNLINGPKELINASNYSDIQELIASCDLLITDYSSTMFEAMIANKPVMLYTNDIENYKKERGTYFKLEELPFPITQNNQEIFEVLKNSNLEKIKEQYNIFKEKVGLKETGQASKRVVTIIEEELKK